MTVAPRSPSSWVAVGPASTRERSSTVRPASAPCCGGSSEAGLIVAPRVRDRPRGGRSRIRGDGSGGERGGGRGGERGTRGAAWRSGFLVARRHVGARARGVGRGGAAALLHEGRGIFVCCGSLSGGRLRLLVAMRRLGGG